MSAHIPSFFPDLQLVPGEQHGETSNEPTCDNQHPSSVSVKYLLTFYFNFGVNFHNLIK